MAGTAVASAEMAGATVAGVEALGDGMGRVNAADAGASVGASRAEAPAAMGVRVPVTLSRCGFRSGRHSHCPICSPARGGAGLGNTAALSLPLALLL